VSKELGVKDDKGKTGGMGRRQQQRGKTARDPSFQGSRGYKREGGGGVKLKGGDVSLRSVIAVFKLHLTRQSTFV